MEAQSLDPVADAIPVLEKLTAQLQTATNERCYLREAYASLTQVLERHIQVMEKNNEYLRYRLLMDGGMHKVAMVNIQATQLTKGTSNLQRVNREEPTNSKEPTNKEAWV